MPGGMRLSRDEWSLGPTGAGWRQLSREERRLLAEQLRQMGNGLKGSTEKTKGSRAKKRSRPPVNSAQDLASTTDDADVELPPPDSGGCHAAAPSDKSEPCQVATLQHPPAVGNKVRKVGEEAEQVCLAETLVEFSQVASKEGESDPLKTSPVRGMRSPRVKGRLGMRGNAKDASGNKRQPKGASQLPAGSQKAPTAAEPQLTAGRAPSRRVRQKPAKLEEMTREEEILMQRALHNSMAVSHSSSNGLDSIPDAPVFRPSEEEFRDPVKYINKIRPEAQKSGLCKVVPPPGWSPPFSMDRATRFWTRRQLIHKLQQGEGFPKSRQYCLDTFQEMALTFERKWLARVGEGIQGPKLGRLLERQFWQLVESGTEEVEVEYGSDLMVGSGFPQQSKGSDGIYEASPWNLLNLPRLEGSLLRHLDGRVPGVTVPWVYVGMLFAAFCFHTEDAYLYSVNYHHMGAAKTWYGIPASEAGAFERAMQQEVPELFSQRPDLLHQLVTAVSPRHLMARKVPLYRIIQEPGEFVITFPQAYHAGFNHGFNCAEAVNFAPPDWLPYGATSVAKYRRHLKTPVLNFQEVVCRAAQSTPSPHIAQWLACQLVVLRWQEAEARDMAAVEGLVRSQQRGPQDCRHGHCSVCRCHLYLSAATCTGSCPPGRQSCLPCAAQLCSCGAQSQMLIYSTTLAELEAMQRNMKAIAKGCPVDKTLPQGLPADKLSPTLTARVLSYRTARVDRIATWMAKALDVLNGDEAIGQAPALLVSAQEFLWGSLHVDKLRSLCWSLAEKLVVEKATLVSGKSE